VSTRTDKPAACRLLFLVGQLGPGGLERQLYYFIRSLDRARYRPAVVMWSGSLNDVYVSRIRALGVPIYSLAHLASPPVKLHACGQFIRQLNPEVVHSYTFYTNFAAYWGVRGTRAVAVGSMRSEFSLAKRDCGRWLGSASARWPRHQIFNSSAAAAVWRSSRTLFVPRRVSVVRNGLDVRQFSNCPDSGPPPARIVGIGSLLPIKRWDRVCRLTAAIKRRGIECAVQIVGDGPLRDRLQRQADELGINDYLEFTGYRDDVSRLLTNSLFLVHTSDSEGCPNAVMEAMASARPVVATDVGDVGSLIDDGKNGFVVQPEDEGALLDRVLALLKDRALCRRMGEAARAKAERQFGMDRVVSETLDAYRAAGWRDAN
jgi:glycosyltransferase involved in cell wall biosynthesis